MYNRDKNGKTKDNSAKKHSGIVRYFVITVISGLIVGFILLYSGMYFTGSPNLVVSAYQSDDEFDLMYKELFDSGQMTEEEIEQEKAVNKKINLNHDLFFTITNQNGGSAIVKRISLMFSNVDKKEDVCYGFIRYMLAEMYETSVMVDSETKIQNIESFHSTRDRNKNFIINSTNSQFIYAQDDSDTFHIYFESPYIENSSTSISADVNVAIEWCDAADCDEKLLISEPIEIKITRDCEYRI